MLMCHKIKNGAIFIADAHDDSERDNFYRFLKAVETDKIKTPQLFIMGDMFDLLVGEVEHGVKKYQKYIDLIDKISLHVEIFYFEGNHDFALAKLFKNVKVIPMQLQPLKYKLEDSTLAYLSHGDKYCGVVHAFYTMVIRSKMVLKLLNFIDRKVDGAVSKKIQSNQTKKDLCRKIENFEKIISEKLSNYQAKKDSYIVEGHYHQNYSFSKNSINYINLPSFACNQSYFIVECFKDNKFALRSCNV